MIKKSRSRLVNNNSNQDGFTILELLIASLVFSMILLIATFAVIQISRTYIKGFVGTQTQNTNRNIVEILTKAIQSSKGSNIIIPTFTVTPPNDIFWFCINDQRFTYQFGKVYDQNSATPDLTPNFIIDTDPQSDNCTTPADITNLTETDYQQLLDAHEQLIPLNGPTVGIIYPITTIDGDTLYQINLKIQYGDPNYYNPTTLQCLPDQETGGFCFDSTSSTSIESRDSIN